jgi:predicted NBD/HSP70 family sugar kinase
LAVGLANLIALFDPEAVIVDCSPAQLGAALLQAAQTALKLSPRAQALARCALLSPQLGDAAPVLGAAAWASCNASSHHALCEKQEARASLP